MAFFPGHFIKIDLIQDAMRGNESVFNDTIAMLNAQNEVPNSNPSYFQFEPSELNEFDFNPITYILDDLFVMRKDIDKQKRSAALIEALHTHCGISIDMKPRPDISLSNTQTMFASDLLYALDRNNFPAFETLLLKCRANFYPNETPLEHMFSGMNQSMRLN